MNHLDCRIESKQNTDVSVIIPIYNSKKYLNRCLKSLHHQKGVNAEFICVDDGSTDNSHLICEKYADMDHRFVIIKNEHKGVSAARNTGLDCAKGKYICFLDSDDCFLKDALCSLFEIAEINQAHTVKFNAEVIGGELWMKDSFIKHDTIIENFIPEDIFRYKDCRPFIWAHFIRNNVLEGIHFNESLILGEDQEFIIRYLSRVKRFVFCGKKLYRHYNYKKSNYNRIISNRDTFCYYHIIIVETIMKQIDLDSKEYAEWIFDMLYYPFTSSSKIDSYREKIIDIIDEKHISDKITDDRKVLLQRLRESV